MGFSFEVRVVVRGSSHSICLEVVSGSEVLAIGTSLVVAASFAAIIA